MMKLQEVQVTEVIQQAYVHALICNLRGPRHFDIWYRMVTDHALRCLGDHVSSCTNNSTYLDLAPVGKGMVECG